VPVSTQRLLGTNSGICQHQTLSDTPRDKPLCLTARTSNNSASLCPTIFVTHPVWVSCHSVDYDEPWYDETDEETFRPWLSEIPVGADEMYLVACQFTMADGSRHQGFATPCFELRRHASNSATNLFALWKEICVLVRDVPPARRNQWLLYGFC
jgi:hypothetical protein